MQAADTRISIQLTVLSFYYEAGISILDNQLSKVLTISAYVISEPSYLEYKPTRVSMSDSLI